MNHAEMLEMMGTEEVLGPRSELLRLAIASIALLVVGIMTSPMFDTIHFESNDIRLLSRSSTVAVEKRSLSPIPTSSSSSSRKKKVAQGLLSTSTSVAEYTYKPRKHFSEVIRISH